jgi:hypothetical protein
MRKFTYKLLCEILRKTVFGGLIEDSVFQILLNLND